MEESTGFDAVISAIQDLGVELIFWVPGYPITELAELLKAEIAVNEKVAFEMALGACATGSRSMVIVKQVGMNLLADPLVISATHTIGSGLVILAGDDLGPKGSQAEMDSRIYGLLAEIPVLDPKDPTSLYASIHEAYQLSELLSIPVIVRITKRLISTSGRTILPFTSKGIGLLFDNAAWDLSVRGRHQRHHQEVLPLAAEASEATLLNRIQISGNIGIIASGYPVKLAEGLGVSLMTIGYSYPLPIRLIRRFIDGHRLVLVAEEPEPCIEMQLGMNPRVRGRLTGHLPFGPLEKSDIIKALETLQEIVTPKEQVYESVADRGYAKVCEGCPYVALFSALASLDAPVAGDAGCAIRATREPYSSVDIVYGLGSSIAVASGFRRKGVAVIGDFALAHTGLPGLINAIWRKREVLVILLKNDVAAMTGGQEVPDLTEILEMLVPTRWIDVSSSRAEIEELLTKELARPGISAVVASGRCVKNRCLSDKILSPEYGRVEDACRDEGC